MKYPYIVKKDGIWYAAGTEVPVAVSGETKEDFSYTKTEIQRKSVSELKEIAEKLEIDGFESMTRSNLKKILIEKFGL